VRFRIAYEGGTATATFRLRPFPDRPEGETSIELSALEGERKIDTTASTVTVFPLELRRGLRVGVVRAHDDTCWRSLLALGLSPSAVESNDLAREDLSAFDVILVPIRAYLSRNDLRLHNGRLLDYVRQGGRVVVMYQKTEEWDPAFAPFPIRISRNRVTREDAPVRVLAGSHPVAVAPNRLGESDWAGWVQERGLYFPDSWDERYAAIFECSDPEEEALRGGCLVAGCGRGTYVYTSLALYRQLAACVPGGYRLFANLLTPPGSAGEIR
jgi:hypothetical protein